MAPRRSAPQAHVEGLKSNVRGQTVPAGYVPGAEAILDYRDRGNVEENACLVRSTRWSPSAGRSRRLRLAPPDFEAATEVPDHRDLALLTYEIPAWRRRTRIEREMSKRTFQIGERHSVDLNHIARLQRVLQMATKVIDRIPPGARHRAQWCSRVRVSFQNGHMIESWRPSPQRICFEFVSGHAWDETMTLEWGATKIQLGAERA